jgi:hypothetical protein
MQDGGEPIFDQVDFGKAFHQLNVRIANAAAQGNV